MGAFFCFYGGFFLFLWGLFSVSMGKFCPECRSDRSRSLKKSPRSDDRCDFAAAAAWLIGRVLPQIVYDCLINS
jgi:hypothetical protein